MIVIVVLGVVAYYIYDIQEMLLVKLIKLGRV